MKTEEKKAFFESLPEMLKGAHIGQLNMIIESGANVYYQQNAPESEKAKDGDHLQGKEAILDYVGRLMPLVRNEYQANYEDLWQGILELNEVKLQVYNRGKQQDTTFNRNLVAQIIHLIGTRLYVPTANTVNMAEYLEPQKGMDHPVRQKLGESPEKPIKKAIEEYMKSIG